MAKKKRAGGGGARKGTAAKGNSVRLDTLLIERGLADDERHALSLILQKKVVADEGKVVVDKAGQLVPKDMPLRVKGAGNAGGGAGASATGGSAEGGVRLGDIKRGLVVAHHGSRVVVEEEEREGGEEAGEERTAKSEGEGEERREEGRETERGDTRVRYTCPLTPGLKELGVITGDVVQFRAAIGDMVGVSGKSADERGVIVDRMERRCVLERPTKALADVNWGSLQALGGERMLDLTKGRKFMCANADVMMIVIAPQPGTVRLLLDAYLVGAHYSGMEAILVLNKCDILPDPSIPVPEAGPSTGGEGAAGGGSQLGFGMG